MAQSLSALYVHIVFSTHDRQPCLIDKAYRSELHAYLGGTSNNLGCPSLIVGGTEDHVHMLVRQSKTVAVAPLVRDIKSNSSTWVKGRLHNDFAWQAGYGAFSVDPTRLGVIRHYIENQEEHHRVVTFKEEFLSILREHEIECDEKYLWD